MKISICIHGDDGKEIGRAWFHHPDIQSDPVTAAGVIERMEQAVKPHDLEWASAEDPFHRYLRERSESRRLHIEAEKL